MLSCTTEKPRPEAKEPDSPKAAVAEKQPESVPEKATVPQPVKEEVKEPVVETAAKTEPDKTAVVETVKEAPKEEPKTAPVEKQPDFVVTEELYKKTFAEIAAVIEDLNAAIKAKNYDVWMNKLTEAYIQDSSGEEFLKKTSESSILKRNGVILKSLKDYFLYVVVPSRSNVKLDKIDFVDQTHVKALTVVQGNPIILYWLVKDKDGWKVDIWRD